MRLRLMQQGQWEQDHRAIKRRVSAMLKMSPRKLTISNPPKLFPARVVMADRYDGPVSTDP